MSTRYEIDTNQNHVIDCLKGIGIILVDLVISLLEFTSKNGSIRSICFFSFSYLDIYLKRKAHLANNSSPV